MQINPAWIHVIIIVIANIISFAVLWTRQITIIEQSIEETQVNIMTSSDAGDVIESELPDCEERFDMAIILFSDSDVYTPACESISFNYDESPAYALKTGEYDVTMLSNKKVLIKAPSEGERRNARIYITK